MALRMANRQGIECNYMCVRYVNVCACIRKRGQYIIANETNTTPDRDRCLEMAA